MTETIVSAQADWPMAILCLALAALAFGVGKWVTSHDPQDEPLPAPMPETKWQYSGGHVDMTPDGVNWDGRE